MRCVRDHAVTVTDLRSKGIANIESDLVACKLILQLQHAQPHVFLRLSVIVEYPAYSSAKRIVLAPDCADAPAGPCTLEKSQLFDQQPSGGVRAVTALSICGRCLVQASAQPGPPAARAAFGKTHRYSAKLNGLGLPRFQRLGAAVE